MTAEEALSALKETRETGQGWLRIAEILDQVRDSAIGGRAGKLSVAFVEEAAEASQYAPAILRRMSSAYTFLKKFDRDHPELRFRRRLGGSATAPFSKLELFARLYRVAPEKALEIASAVADGTLTQRELNLIYRETSGQPQRHHLNEDQSGEFLVPHSVNKFEARTKMLRPPFLDVFWKALRKDVTMLSGEGDIRLFRNHRFTYFTPSAVAVGMNDFGIDFVDGFYFVTTPIEFSRTQMNEVLKNIAFQAPFFRRYWVLTGPIGATAEKMRRDLSVFGLDAVGFAELQKGGLTVTQKASAMRTVQQQGILASEILEKGIPKTN